MTAAGDLYPTAALYLLLVNSITYAAFWIDKTQARKRGYRLSENALLLLSALGGSPCALLARSYLRHKTKKSLSRHCFSSLSGSRRSWLVGFSSPLHPAIHV